MFVGLAPFLGALVLTVMFWIAAFYYSNPANSFVTGQAWFKFVHFSFSIGGWDIYVRKGLGPPVVLGIGLILVGVPLMLIWRHRHREFFEHRREVAESLEASAPPLTPGVLPVTD